MVFQKIYLFCTNDKWQTLEMYLSYTLGLSLSLSLTRTRSLAEMTRSHEYHKEEICRAYQPTDRCIKSEMHCEPRTGFRWVLLERECVSRV